MFSGKFKTFLRPVLLLLSIKPLLTTSGKDGKELSASSGNGPDAISTGIGWTADVNDENPWLQYDPAQLYKLWALSTWGTGAGDAMG